MAANQCQQNYKMSDKEIKVPNIGEFKDVEVIEVLVSRSSQFLKMIHLLQLRVTNLVLKYQLLLMERLSLLKLKWEIEFQKVI